MAHQVKIVDAASKTVDAIVSSEKYAQVDYQLDQKRDLSLRPVPAVDISVRNVNVTIHHGTIKLPWLSRKKKVNMGDAEVAVSESQNKAILNKISADFPTGTLTAILGSSGSGKTSLLNVLADRIRDSKLDISGHITFNGNDAASSEARSAYVMQQDVHDGTLTIRETLRFAAGLRLRDDMPISERWQIVEEVILELSLKNVADTRLKYCSGGERRRTSLGIQMLANPSILWLDEPTTGLDASSAYQLVQTLRSLASKGRTVVLTIHQPRSEIWTLFDRILLLSQGSCVYAEAMEDCMDYFADLDFPLPPFCNPAEHVIDIAAIDNRSDELETASQARVDRLKAEWSQHSQEYYSTTTPTMTEKRRQSSRSSFITTTKGVPFSRQLRILTSRAWLTTYRDPLGLFGTFFEAIAMGIVMGWIFYKLDGSLAGIRSRVGAMYVAAALQGYLVLLYEIHRLILDIEIFDRERAESVVDVPAFLISRRIAKLLEDIAVPLLFSVIFYFMTGFRIEGETFMVFFGVVLLGQYIAVTYATLSVALSRDFAVANLIANLSYTWQTFACGFFVLATSMPSYLRWTRFTSYVWYSFGALSFNEFSNQIYDCPEPGGASNPNCAQYEGNFQLQTFGILPNWIWRPLVILVSWVILYFILSAVVLQYNRQEIRVANARPQDADKSAGKERVGAGSDNVVRPVRVQLQQYAITVNRSGVERKGADSKIYKPATRTIEILKPISTVFEAGMLNVIMGPSGSGKTSLLASIANRLKSDLISRYQIQGQLLLNGAEPSRDTLQSIVSFVTQDDDALLSKLTVRETLRFAAGLRLPKEMTTEQKNARAEEVLKQMGLKDCANSIVGSDKMKGISGGERRRCTIAIQILTDPRLILLDEPTSGLDGFTASSIMTVLKGLADEGRTIIMTIHQSRSDHWPLFGNVLLLARGGHPVYAGPREAMIDHLADQGYQCPETTNPADFALDLITIDLRHQTQEDATKLKVAGLIDAWKNASEDRTAQPAGDRPSIDQPAQLGALVKSKTAFSIAFPILVHRSWLNLWRQPELMIGRVMQVLGLSILVAFFMAPLKTDYYSIQTRLGFIQQIAPVYFVGMLNNLAIYPFEQAVFYREHADRVYGVEAFLLQYTSLELPFEIITCLLFSTLATFAVRLPYTAEAYFVVFYNVFCIVNCGESLGIVFNALIQHTGFAVNVMSVFLSVSQIMGGTMSLNIPPFLQAWNHLSPIKWAIPSLAHVAFDGITFDCLPAQRLPDGSCPLLTGEGIIAQYNLDMELWRAVVALGAVTLGYRLFAYAVLKVKQDKLYNVFKKRGWKKQEI